MGILFQLASGRKYTNDQLEMTLSWLSLKRIVASAVSGLLLLFTVACGGGGTAARDNEGKKSEYSVEHVVEVFNESGVPVVIGRDLRGQKNLHPVILAILDLRSNTDEVSDFSVAVFRSAHDAERYVRALPKNNPQKRFLHRANVLVFYGPVRDAAFVQGIQDALKKL